MGVVETTSWICDRCGRMEQKQDERNWQPDDWAQLNECVPPRSDVSDRDVLGVICRPCRSDLRTWMADAPQAEASA